MYADSARSARCEHGRGQRVPRRAWVSDASDFAIASSYNDPQQKRGGHDMRSFAPALIATLALTATLSAVSYTHLTLPTNREV